jgi:uncharacterized protein YjbI with pentapeptide repeats
MRVRLLLQTTVLLFIAAQGGLATEASETAVSQNNVNVEGRVDSRSNDNTGNPAADSERARLAQQKAEIELEKLRAEVAGLKITNEAMGWWTKFLTAWLAAVGSIIAGLLIWVLGRSLNKTQQKKLDQDMELDAKRHALESSKLQQDKDLSLEKHKLESDKLDQDRKLGREKHNLEVFNALGSTEPRSRIGAVAILIQRIAALYGKVPLSPDEKEEMDMLVSVLISVTKHENKEEVQKYIADGLSDSLKAIVPDEIEKPTSDASPLKPYDFQGAKLENAWWRRIDARGVDFYKAHLVRAGLSQAFLSGTVLKNADLTKATLVKAQLDGANLQGAQLVDAKLTKANLKKANLKGANLDGADLTDADLDEADLSGATLNGTILKGARRGSAKFDGVDLSKAISDPEANA